MNTNKGRNGRNGSAIFTVIVLMVVLSLVIGVVAAISAQRTFSVRRLADQTRALAIAEAGANEAYSQLQADWEARWSDDAFPPKTFGGGSYDVAVQAVTNASLAVITSTGVYRGVTNVVVVDIAKAASTPGSTVPPNEAFGYAIVSGGDMTWNGSGVTDATGGRVHTNGRFTMTGCSIGIGTLSSCLGIRSVGTTIINGDAEAPLFENKSPANVTGTATPMVVPVVMIPDIDLTPYYNEALRNGEVYNGDVHISGSGNIAPNGGIMWVNGNLRLNTSGSMTGCFIATGDVRYDGSGDQVKVESYPAFVSRDGDIIHTGSGKNHGLFYAPRGDFRKSGAGGGEIRGAIICGGLFDKTGNWDALVYEDSYPVPPGSATSPQDGPVYVSAWQK